jgi:hypothetical protein
MAMKIKGLAILLILGLLIQVKPLFGQEETALAEAEKTAEDRGPTLSFGADLMSRYIWRGRDYGNSPAIQPNICFSWKGLSIGAWGSYAFAKHSILINDTLIEEAGNYSEADLYVSYTFKWFTLMVFDYFTVNGLNPNEGNRYFNFNNQTTGHTVEALLSFDGPETFPVQMIVSTLVYGADKNKDSSGVYGQGDKNNFSTYFEAGYTFDIRKAGIKLKPFIGAIPFGGSWYGPYGGVINVGFTAKKEIPVTEHYALPVQASLITNPQAQSIFFVFGISI